MSSDRAGYSGRGNLLVGDTTMTLTLFKSSTRHSPFSKILDVKKNVYITESYMNISGPSIAAACRQSVKFPSSMIVLTDSLSHEVETLSVKLGGSANGHNGVKSIISALGGEMGFYRFRLGIGRDESDAATYVMRQLSSHERRYWTDEGLDLILKEIERVALKAG